MSNGFTPGQQISPHVTQQYKSHVTKMKLTINSQNYESLIRKEKYLIFDINFIQENSITNDSYIEIDGLKNNTIVFILDSVQLQDLKIDIKNCTFDGFYVKNTTLNELKIISCVISSFKETKFRLFDTFFAKSNIKTLWVFDSKFFGGLLIKNESMIDSFFINNIICDYSFTYVNSTSKIITIESSQLENLYIESNDYPIKGAKAEIETINVFRTEIHKSFTVWEVDFKKICLLKISMQASNQIEVFENELKISVSNQNKDSEKIDIIESTLNCNSLIIVNNLKSLYSYNSTLKNFNVAFWKIDNFSFYNNKITEGIFWGQRNRYKIIDEFIFNNCSVMGQFDLCNITFSKKLLINGNSFNFYPSFFLSNTILENCCVDFEFSDLTNLIFQNINFKNLSFKSIDVSNSSFKDCKWILEKGFLFDRLKVYDEREGNNIELIDLKRIYSSLKINFQNNNDYITSGRFYISEQETKRRISLKNKSWFEYLILSIHKFISSYGESAYKPFIWMILFGFLFSFIYLFSGFYMGHRLICYRIVFVPQNLFQTLQDWLLSVVLSFKNIVPFSVNDNFFLLIDKTLTFSQVLELFQRFVFIIFFGSFTEAFVRYLKK